MKQHLIYAMAATLVALSSCNGDKLRMAEQRNDTLTDSLQTALAAQDSLLVLMNDITEGMYRIKDMEQILNTSDLTAENVSKRDQIRHDMELIQRSLEQRRVRLAELEKKLNQSNQNNALLQRTVQNLKAEIADQEATINSLRNDLKAAKIEISELNTRVDSLNTTVADERSAKEQAQQETKNVTDELNTCYYALGTKSELKRAGIVESGFLRKTKVMKGDFEQSYFKRGDKREVSAIETHSKKAKLLSNSPADSYEFVDVDGTKVLKIKDPAKFWSLTNYLIIEVD